MPHRSYSIQRLPAYRTPRATDPARGLGAVQRGFGIQKAAVITAELIVDGAGQGQVPHLAISVVIKIRGVHNPCHSAVSIVEGMDIYKVKVGYKGADQQIRICIPKSKPLFHQCRNRFRSGRIMDSLSCISDIDHAVPV